MKRILMLQHLNATKEIAFKKKSLTSPLALKISSMRMQARIFFQILNCKILPC